MNARRGRGTDVGRRGVDGRARGTGRGRGGSGGARRCGGRHGGRRSALHVEGWRTSAVGRARAGAWSRGGGRGRSGAGSAGGRRPGAGVGAGGGASAHGVRRARGGWAVGGCRARGLASGPRCGGGAARRGRCRASRYGTLHVAITGTARRRGGWHGRSPRRGRRRRCTGGRRERLDGTGPHGGRDAVHRRRTGGRARSICVRYRSLRGDRVPTGRYRGKGCRIALHCTGVAGRGGVPVAMTGGCPLDLDRLLGRRTGRLWRRGVGAGRGGVLVAG